MKKNKKKLSVGWVLFIIWGSIAITAGVVVGVLAMNGAFDEKEECNDIPSGGVYYRGAYLPSGDKPIIYLYPENKTEVSVKLGAPEKLLVSYPLYDGGWEVLAEPDGKLTDLKTNRELYSLYWEGKNNSIPVTDEGFVVKGEDTVEFLEEKLALLGLNNRETEEFIIYWLPKLQSNEYNYIRFASMEEIESYMPLLVTPKPDTIIRIMMIASSLDNPIEIKEQELPPAPERNGFTVVEWGGSIVK